MNEDIESCIHIDLTSSESLWDPMSNPHISCVTSVEEEDIKVLDTDCDKSYDLDREFLRIHAVTSTIHGSLTTESLAKLWHISEESESDVIRAMV